MKLINLIKNKEGKFLTYYVANYLNSDGKTKAYEFFSRNKNLTLDNFGTIDPVGVGIIALSNDDKKILVQLEFRMACNQLVCSFPTGLIDEGETAEMAGKRELWEETGLELTEIIDILPPSFASAPTSDEVMTLIICHAQGEIQKSTSADEEIIAKWYTKEEVKKLFEDKVMMSVRTQIYLYNWMNR